MTEAWVAATAGKTTVKLGRMELDTPLVFTETWSIEKNTFEAAVVINQDIPDTTLVGAYVGNGNGTETYGQDVNGTVIGNDLAIGAVVNQDGQFTTYGTDGAYAAGIINNSFKPLTVQAWYYDLTRLATAYWLQADLNMEGILAGAQYTAQDVKNGNTLGITNTDTASTYALMLGYEMKDVATIKVAYSDSNDKGALTAANTATNSGQSKLYTEAWWNYGKVTQHDTDSFAVIVTGKVADVDLLAQYTYADQESKIVAGTETQNNDLSEFTVTAGKSFGPLDATLAYVYADVEDNDSATDDKSSTIQAYLTLNF
jgi:ureidoglycolate hydrolase